MAIDFISYPAKSVTTINTFQMLSRSSTIQCLTDNNVGLNKTFITDIINSQTNDREEEEAERREREGTTTTASTSSEKSLKDQVPQVAHMFIDIICEVLYQVKKKM